MKDELRDIVAFEDLLHALRDQRLPVCPTAPRTTGSTPAAPSTPAADPTASGVPATPGAPATTAAPADTTSAPSTSARTPSPEPGVDCREAD